MGVLVNGSCIRQTALLNRQLKAAKATLFGALVSPPETQSLLQASVLVEER